MLKRSQFWLLSGIGAACVAFTVVNMLLFSGNQALQRQVTQRTQFVQQSVQLEGLYQQIVRALANLSVRDKDAQLSAILARQGLKVTVNAHAPANSGTASPQSKPGPGRPGRGKHHE